MTTNPDDLFDHLLVLRTASAPFTELGDEEEFYQRIARDQSFLQALRHANPFVYLRATEWMAGTLTDPKKVAKIRHTLYNYYTRWYLTATPYGFFSGVGTIEWGDGTGAQLEGFHQSYRIDMDVLSKVAERIFAEPSIRNAIRYFPNNTIYGSGEQLRFLEAFDEGSKIGYKISAVEQSDVLLDMLNNAADGITIPALARLYVNDDYSFEDLCSFIGELVDAQLLLPETRLNISGPDVLTRLHDIVAALPIAGDPGYDNVLRLLSGLKDIVARCGTEDYSSLDEEMKNILRTAGINFQDKALIQVDKFLTLREGTLDRQLSKDLLDAASALSCFNQNDYQPYLETFKRKFNERYEGNSIPLLQALDSESGISFGEVAFQNDSILLKDVTFTPPAGDYISRSAKGDELRALFYEKYYRAMQSGADAIVFTRTEMADKGPKLPRLAPSFQILFDVVDREKKLLHLRTAGNSSGASLLSRFCYASTELTGMLNRTATWEAEHFNNFIVAEVVHISSYRTGNITFRPDFRGYEIPVYVQSVLPPERQISLTDLMVCVRDRKIILWSRRLQKRVIPMLTNAHNFSMNTTPAYQFLAEVACQETIPSLFLDRAETTSIGNYVPRIQFENVILYPATWRFNQAELKELADRADSLTAEDLTRFREKWKLAEKTELFDGGSDIFVDWTSLFSVRYFLKTVKGRGGTIFFKELLFNPESALVNDTEGRPYLSECIAIVQNRMRSKEGTSFTRESSIPITQKFHPGDEWIYYKLYCGVVTGDKLLGREIADLVRTLYDRELISGFFFIRYNDPEYHLRLRFKTERGQVPEVMKAVQEHLASALKQELIARMQMDTYVRELDRYGHESIDFAEAVFGIDSLFLLEAIPLIRESYAAVSPFLFMKAIDCMLEAFGLTRSEKLDFLNGRKQGYENEFRLASNPALKAVLLRKEQQYRRTIQSLLREGLSALPGGLDTEELEAALQRYENRLRKLYGDESQRLGEPPPLRELMPSFAHMHAIRLFQTKPRENEFVAYQLFHASFFAMLKNETIKYDEATRNS